MYGSEPYWPAGKLKICITGAGGFIASHLAKRLKEEGHYIVGCDWKRNEHMPVRSRAGLAAVLGWTVLVVLAMVGAAPPIAPRADFPSRRTCCVSPILQEEMFCHEFILADLRVYDNCAKVLKGCEHCFNLAADMGGMGFIQSNHGVIFYNNTMISFNMLEAARKEGITRCALGHQVRSDRPTH